MVLSVSSPDVALTDRLRHIAADVVTHAVGDTGQARVVLTSGGPSGPVRARVTVAREGQTFEAEGAAGSAEYAVVNAALSLRALLGVPTRSAHPCDTLSS